MCAKQVWLRKDRLVSAITLTYSSAVNHHRHKSSTTDKQSQPPLKSSSITTVTVSKKRSQPHHHRNQHPRHHHGHDHLKTTQATGGSATIRTPTTEPIIVNLKSLECFCSALSKLGRWMFRHSKYCCSAEFHIWMLDGSDLSWDGIPIIQQVASGPPTARPISNFVSILRNKQEQIALERSVRLNMDLGRGN